MPKNLTHTSKPAFDDRSLSIDPVTKLSLEQAEKLESIAMSLLQEEWDKLRKEQPELFASHSKDLIHK